MSGLVAMQLKSALGLPFVVTFHALGLVRRLHQGAADEFSPQRIAIERDIIRTADAVVAECPDDRRDLMSLYDAEPHKIVVIPCGFSPNEFWPIAPRFARRALGLPADVPILLSVGRLVPRKGVDNVIRALRVLVQRFGMPAQLLVIGGGSDTGDCALTPEIGRLSAIAAAEGVADRVTFTGRRSHELLKLYYSAADVFVTTPWYEPFGMTSVEAMACGTPVVGARVGGIRYSVVDQHTGFLVPPHDPDALADRLNDVCCAPRLAERFAGQAVRRAYGLFRWERVAHLLAAQYAEIPRPRVVLDAAVAALPAPVRDVVVAA
jgi:glycosyltransferase involved in cell wall biosynthesis